ncbi:MAG: lipopolysaccharide biosynthesis protein RfbH [Candidatus Omnitrophica bacterium]|nr:lipopolysaccharide biosynthesis protein RfbH [Candidatus Omnitrophota bacterium]
MSLKKIIKREIFSKIKEYHAASQSKHFIPGKTYINYAGRVFDDRELVNLVDASLDFWLTAGKYAHEFEKKLATFLGAKHCDLVNSGSSANLIAISALTSPLLKKRALVPGDEVITIACGFPTTVNPILQNNLIPVFIDVELGSYGIEVDKIERAISKKTKAIFIAHTLGNPADIKEILRVAKKYKLWFIEDNCDALGSKYGGHYTGTFGHIATCSFYPAHTITTGEGGAVLTDDSLLRRIMLSFRDWGRDCWCEAGHDNTCGRRFRQQLGKLPFGYDHKYSYAHIGYNLKITDLQAAIGCAQLKKLSKFLHVRKQNFDYLYRHLEKYEKYFVLPQPVKNSVPAWFGFPLLVRGTAPFTRNEIVEYLEKNKIATRMLFGGNLTRQPAYAGIRCRIPFGLKNTDLVMNNLFWIGVYPGITKEMLAHIAQCFDSFPPLSVTSESHIF